MKKVFDRISRRNFIGAGVAAFAASIAGLTCHAPVADAAPTPPKIRVSAFSYSFRGLLKDGKMDVFSYIESCKYRYGLDAADIWNSHAPRFRRDRRILDRRAVRPHRQTLQGICPVGARSGVQGRRREPLGARKILGEPEEALPGRRPSRLRSFHPRIRLMGRYARRKGRGGPRGGALGVAHAPRFQQI